jgi:hypothetical protein
MNRGNKKIAIVLSNLYILYTSLALLIDFELSKVTYIEVVGFEL